MEPYYTDVEVSKKLGKSIMAVWNMANRGELPSKRVDGKRVYPKYAIDSMLTARQITSNGSTKLSSKSNENPLLTTPNSRKLSKTADENGSKYVTLEQLAFALQRTQTDIERMIRRKEIKTETINGRDWISKNEVERIISKRDPQRQARIRRRLPQPHELSEQSPVKTSPSVISGTELVNAAQRFGISTNKIRQMIAEGELIQHPIEGHLVEPTPSESGRVPDTSKIKGTSPAKGRRWNSHYTLREAAEKLDKSPDEVLEMVYMSILSVSTIRGERVFPKEDVDNLIPNSYPESVQSKSSQNREISSKATLAEDPFAEDRYYTPGQAALLLSKDAYEINRMINREELPVLRVNTFLWIPEQSVESLLTESEQRRWQRQENRPIAYKVRKSEIQKATSPNQTEQQAEEDGSESEASVHLDSPQDSSGISSGASHSHSESALEEVIEMLRDELLAEKEQNQHLTEELEQERTDHGQDAQSAQYEIDQLNAEIENLHQDSALQSETLTEDLEEERRMRIESDLRIEELQDQLEQVRQSRTGVKGVVGSLRGLISHEDDTEDSQRHDLHLALEEAKHELEEEKDRWRKNEERLGALQSQLEQNEASKRVLERALSSEKVKIIRLKEEKRMLDEVRRVLGAGTLQPSESAESATPVDGRREEPSNTNNELLIDTQYGRWSFRPPFALEEEEIALIRLVVGVDEITAGQIKHRTGRRRAADDLDDLLERLADEGMEPIKVNEDRYSFDPEFLQN